MGSQIQPSSNPLAQKIPGVLTSSLLPAPSLDARTQAHPPPRNASRLLPKFSNPCLLQVDKVFCSLLKTTKVCPTARFKSPQASSLGLCPLAFHLWWIVPQS